VPKKSILVELKTKHLEGTGAYGEPLAVTGSGAALFDSEHLEAGEKGL
jgi:hypothetical protein